MKTITILKTIAKAILITAAIMLIFLLSLFVPVEAATNDDLAFDFVSAKASPLIAVDECVERGIYTVNQGDSVKSDDLIHEYNIDDFDNIGDFCQQVYEELYPLEYKTNEMIRGIVK